MQKTEKIHLEFSILTTTIIQNDLPLTAVEPLGHFVYLDPFIFRQLSNKTLFTVKFKSIFQSLQKKSEPIFITTTEFLLNNLSIKIDEDQIHHLVDFGMNQHLKALVEVSHDRDYLKFLNTNPNSIRFSNQVIMFLMGLKQNSK
jgi:hypothetical protein